MADVLIEARNDGQEIEQAINQELKKASGRSGTTGGGRKRKRFIIFPSPT